MSVDMSSFSYSGCPNVIVDESGTAWNQAAPLYATLSDRQETIGNRQPGHRAEGFAMLRIVPERRQAEPQT
jgi:hypothetical protein